MSQKRGKYIMEIIKLTNKDNIINSYGIRPTLPYDIEGVLVEKNGKDIKIEKMIDSKVIEYSLRLKEEIKANPGDNIKVEKENVVSVKVEEKEELVKNEQLSRKVEDIIRELGLEYTEENIRMIEHLLSSGIMITKENINSYIKSKEYLNKIIQELDRDSFVKLMDKGIDLDSENLQKIAQALEDVKNEKTPFSLKRFLKIEKDLTYKEAEEISKEIYGQKMGKDVYDTIIALHKEKLPITKENINKTIEVMSKIYNLKGVKDETYVKILNEDRIFNIDNLYKINNSYTITTIEDNIEANNFESFTVKEETTISNLKEMLTNLDLDDNLVNINILREFIVNDMTMDKDSYNKVISMKQAVKELIELLDYEEITRLDIKEIDLVKENIFNLVEELKRENRNKEIEQPLNSEKTHKIIKELEVLGKITDKDFLELIKNGEDFNLKVIKEIIDTNIPKELSAEHKTLDKTVYIADILNTLGESLSLETISFTARRFNLITLENLYTSQSEIKEIQANIESINKVQETLIYEEYIRARNNLSTNMIKESIKDGKLLEHMPLNELNHYMENKTNKYKESSRKTEEIIKIKGHEERIIPIIMKNNLSMNLKEIKDINLLLNGEKGISNILKNIRESNNQRYDEEFKAEIKLIQEKISTMIKNGDTTIKEEYKALINSLGGSKDSSNENDHQQKDEKLEEYLDVHRKISQKDMVLQLPIEIDNEYKNLNIIVPDINKGIDKNNMKFYISLQTENLGMITMDIHVKGKEVLIDIEDNNDILKSRIIVLEEGLQRLGYTLVEQNKTVIL